MRRDLKVAKVYNDPNFKVSLRNKHERSECLGACYTYSKDNLIPRVFHLPTPPGAREEKGQSLLSLEPLHSLSKPP